MKEYFEGVYYKHQVAGASLAIIAGKSVDSAFIQVITDDCSYNVAYPLSKYSVGDVIEVHESIFSNNTINLNINEPELTLKGEIKYSNLAPLKTDIMGPFRFFPMECRHTVISMRHSLLGQITINEKLIDFSGGVGYIEGDSGASFPKQYAWIHCNDFKEDISIMVSIAKIPFYGLRFWGCICVVWINGREYRLATYNGVKIARCELGSIEIVQGRYKLKVMYDVGNGHELNAPTAGRMCRVIRENISCPARFVFMENDKVVLDVSSMRASCEYSM